jgi:uncharacterized cupredoxin-like copper-binding protein
MHSIHPRTFTTDRPLRRLALSTAALLLLPALAAACGAAPTPTEEPTAVPPTALAAPVATEAVTTTTGAATTVNVTAKETDTGIVFEVDQAAVPAGPVHFVLNNAGKMTHEMWVYPVQDFRAMMALKRQDKEAGEEEYLKGLVGGVEDVEPGKSATLDGELKPGFYEVACFVRSKNADGTTFVHYDKGQYFTLAVTGPGGPSTDIVTPASTMNVESVDGTDGTSWLMVPDKLVVSAGDVTFNVTNKMKEQHDFTIYPIGDVSAFVTKQLAGEKPDPATIKAIEVAEDIAAGQTATKTVKLEPGVYAAVCFIVSKDADGTSYLHSDRGQRFVFTVK